MATNFPDSPSLNDTFVSAGFTYTWDGTVWAASGSAAFVQKSGDTMSGALAIDADLTVDTDTLYVDSTNNRVGIGATSPAVELDVNGEVRASTGVLFGTDTAAVNTLDDYEEGSWTPVFKGDATAGTYTYSSQLGRYTKIGNTVTVHASLEQINTVSAGSGSIFIGGLPFTSSSDLVFPIGVARLDDFNIPTSTCDLNATMVQNTTDLLIVASRDSLSATGIGVTAKLSNTADIYVSCTYRAA